MPLEIQADETGIIELDELVEYLLAEKIDTADQDSLASAAPMLKKLSNNRNFLIDSITSELKNYRKLQDGNPYSSQIYMLKMPSPSLNMNFGIRACFWPSERETIFKSTGNEFFTYQLPHDHNFNFLTVGYHGPGYISDYFEYEYKDAVGYPKEKVNLKFTERTSLSPGKILLYRAFKDVHNQMPNERFSISINILEVSDRSEFCDQYSFDSNYARVDRIMNPTSLPALFGAVASCDSGEGKEILKSISKNHVSSRVRFQALDALASASGDAADFINILSSIPNNAPALIREWSKYRINEIESLL